nr:FHA domain-containing protein [Pyrinomonadaceae bacterium]
MAQVTLHIDSPDGERDVSLDDELTIGRTEPSSLIISDTGLSRRNTTVFRDGDDVLVVDEGSTNGTFLNGKQLGSSPVVLKNGDVLKLGTYTTITVDLGTPEPKPINEPGPEKPRTTEQKPVATKPTAEKDHSTKILAASVGMIAVIVVSSIIALAFFSGEPATVASNAGNSTP